jgi:hypothetical protein
LKKFAKLKGISIRGKNNKEEHINAIQEFLKLQD